MVNKGLKPVTRMNALWSHRGRHGSARTASNRGWRQRHDAAGSDPSVDRAWDAGLDLTPWRDLILARSHAASETRGPSAPPPASANRALCTADLPSVPPKRQWLHGSDLVRGALSLLVAPGGRGKSSWLVTLSLACASNRSLLGGHVFGRGDRMVGWMAPLRHRRAKLVF